MENAWLLVLAGVLGVAIGIAAMWILRSPSAPAGGSEAQRDRVDDDVASILSTLRSASVLLSAQDEVIRATPPAYSLGLVRGGGLQYTELRDLVSQARAEGSVQDAQVNLRRSRGQSETLALDIRVAVLPAGRILILADDRTAEHRVEQIRRDFVANVSHELKTPVGAIALLAETAFDAADDPAAVRRFAGRMQRESVRLSALVQEIIELSRLQAPERVVDFTVLPIDDVIREAVDRVKLESEARDMTVSIGGQDELLVLGDHGLLVTAVRNLLDNALRYSPYGSPVNVGVRAVDGMVEIAVVDQGVGISAENTRRVFERFYRVDPARSRETGGTGLGLSIVKHVAANHGGEVSVWSSRGRGSTFTLRVPQADRDVAVDSVPSPAEHAVLEAPGTKAKPPVGASASRPKTITAEGDPQ